MSADPKTMKRNFFILAVLLLATCASLSAAELPAPAQPAESAVNATAPEAPFCLWYRQPATNWNEALPLGNGRLGAMVFGTPGKERLQLNEESLWAGCPVEAWPPDFPKHLAEVRRRYEEIVLAQTRYEAPRSYSLTTSLSF